MSLKQCGLSAHHGIERQSVASHVNIHRVVLDAPTNNRVLQEYTARARKKVEDTVIQEAPVKKYQISKEEINKILRR